MMCPTSSVIRYVCVCYGGKKREKKGKNGERNEREVLFLLSWEERDDLPHDLNSQFNFISYIYLSNYLFIHILSLYFNTLI